MFAANAPAGAPHKAPTTDGSLVALFLLPLWEKPAPDSIRGARLRRQDAEANGEAGPKGEPKDRGESQRMGGF